MRVLTGVTLALLAGCGPQVEGPAIFSTAAGPEGAYAVALQSVEDRRYAGVIRQRYDFSCGSAALATLLRYHYDFEVREETAFRGMWFSGDREQIRRAGFSLLDMKRWLASRGLSADGYQVSLDEIARTGVPGIALIAVRNYRHFVVVKGVRGDEVLLGDPSIGLTAMPRDAFAAALNGIYFVLADDQPLAKERFNRDSQWSAYTRADVAGRFTEPVSHQALMLTAPFYRDLS